ncbi:hypothetical protein JX265_010297 [Neoarthrinium moseri]|uniref:NACHT-NTPase and P-loop NTPases N-terminal domain-containing protein n=1 Tax=Neoarthrinium moseri TaxID=1658444 RepID=A0A9Q0ALZ9_9PEZI|nr:uncharacterized protein JN550_003504 [Neoarthrinium moseri]KAI1844240.1 hypothetical protein JX266_009531 [Neoarthrinium moseri]KAI1859848.1 hypothetical protein JX265_010297 [Neoarthrinium moseri]KAI1873251.1 hypothetical protein JN550_003504 [Neoarthrinium moseri]
MSGSTAPQIARCVRDTIGSLDKITDVYEAIDDADDLPPAFEEVFKAVSPATTALKSIKAYLAKKKPEGDMDADKNTAQKEKAAAEKFQAAAAHLYDIYDRVVPAGDGPRMARYRSAAGKSGRIEVLMKGILDGILVLAKEPIFSKDQIAAIKKALEEVLKIPKSLTDETGQGVYNYGSGPQTVHYGQGDQNINTGPSPQLNGKFMREINVNPVMPKPDTLDHKSRTH